MAGLAPQPAVGTEAEEADDDTMFSQHEAAELSPVAWGVADLLERGAGMLDSQHDSRAELELHVPGMRRVLPALTHRALVDRAV